MSSFFLIAVPASVERQVVIVQCVFDGLHTLTAPGADNVVRHEISKGARFMGMQTVDHADFAGLIFVDMVGKISGAVAPRIGIGVVGVVRKQSFTRLGVRAECVN